MFYIFLIKDKWKILYRLSYSTIQHIDSLQKYTKRKAKTQIIMIRRTILQTETYTASFSPPCIIRTCTYAHFHYKYIQYTSICTLYNLLYLFTMWSMIVISKAFNNQVNTVLYIKQHAVYMYLFYVVSYEIIRVKRPFDLTLTCYELFNVCLFLPGKMKVNVNHYYWKMKEFSFTFCSL